jgi:hypothetical protein
MHHIDLFAIQVFLIYSMGKLDFNYLVTLISMALSKSSFATTISSSLFSFKMSTPNYGSFD